jgi:hypothetical protein
MVMAIKAFNDSVIINMFPEVADALEEMENGQHIKGHELVQLTGPFTSSVLEPCPTIPIEQKKATYAIPNAW